MEIIWELEFWKLNLGNGILEIKFKKLEFWKLNLKEIGIIWELEFWKLNLGNGILEIISSMKFWKI